MDVEVSEDGETFETLVRRRRREERTDIRWRDGLRHDWLPAEPEPAIEECDWNRWLGPCPWRPYNSKYVSGGWRGFTDFHGGGRDTRYQGASEKGWC